MPDQTEGLFDVRSANTGAQVIIAVDHATALTECERLNREARRIDRWKNEPVGMQQGRITRYEIVSVGGIIMEG